MTQPGFDEHAGLRIDAGGISWHAIASGPPSGRVVLLLHGFPEHAESWRRQLEPLASFGFRAVAADLPGYAGTDDPDGYSLTRIGELVGALASELGGVHLVGHDWGAIISCAVAARWPTAVRSVAIACGPHPAAFAWSLRSPLQIAKSWYVGAFLLPGTARLLGARRGALARRLFKNAVSDLSDVGDMQRALAYYRTNLNPVRLGRHVIGHVEQPALIIHARRDRYLSQGLLRRSADFFDDLRAFEVIDSGHFVHRERSAEFNRVLLDFLGAVR
jgi:epoxide hydrolase 4